MEEGFGQFGIQEQVSKKSKYCFLTMYVANEIQNGNETSFQDINKKIETLTKVIAEHKITVSDAFTSQIH